MSTRKLYQLVCNAQPDGPDWPPCMNASESSGGFAPLESHRTYLKSQGWHHTRDGRDICPSCWADGHRLTRLSCPRPPRKATTVKLLSVADNGTTVVELTDAEAHALRNVLPDLTGSATAHALQRHLAMAHGEIGHQHATPTPA